jgi:hypothetical protein
MQAVLRVVQAYGRLGDDVMPIQAWNIFIKVLALVFLAYWLHLSQGLDDWLGAEGFHPPSVTAAVFGPLSSLGALILWWLTFLGGLLLLISLPTTVALGCILAGGGLFYATMCDPVSMGALNMHFLFAFAVIFWSTGLMRRSAGFMMAWPAYLIRLYLVVVYFGSGWRKTVYGNWLDNPHALLQCMSGYYPTSISRSLYGALPLFSWTALQYLTVVFELGAPLLLLYGPLRRWGTVTGCSLHLGIALLMKGLFYFSFQMMAFYIPVMIHVSHFSGATLKRGHQSEI